MGYAVYHEELEDNILFGKVTHGWYILCESSRLSRCSNSNGLRHHWTSIWAGIYWNEGVRQHRKISRKFRPNTNNYAYSYGSHRNLRYLRFNNRLTFDILGLVTLSIPDDFD